MNTIEQDNTEETGRCCEHHGYDHGYGHHRHKWLALGLILFAALGGLFVGRLVLAHATREFGSAHISVNRQVETGGRGMMGDGMGGRHLGLGGGEERAALVGVVTALDGSKLTVAGNGATTTVQTDNSTRYVGGSSAKVNDTVRVIGTQNNGVWTATTIRIN
jgi:hypothetical protein